MTETMNEIFLDVHNLSKTYRSGELSLTVLNGVSFAVEEGTTCAIIGPSGSGKTTLLGLCAGLDQATSGSVVLGGTSLNALSEDERAGIRNRQVGFVFQNFQLIPTLSALENAMVPLELRGDGNPRGVAVEFLERVCTTTRYSSREASSSAWRWLALSSTGPGSCSSTSPPATWMPLPAAGWRTSSSP